MATATQKGRAPTGPSRGAEGASESASMEFLIVEDNGGKYHWTLLDRQAENAASVVLAGAGSARLVRRAATDSSVEIPSAKQVPITG
jgi:hypothetical protein